MSDFKDKLFIKYVEKYSVKNVDEIFDPKFRPPDCVADFMLRYKLQEEYKAYGEV
ncbi:MAG: hypothetical protein II393_01615 [Cytophagales bacterium]|nr:hypothetical protein [Cytophagales bacterium]